MRLTRTVFASLLVLAMAGAVAAQERRPLPAKEKNLYVVSVKAGVVNDVAGDVSFKRGKKDWDMLIAGDELVDGDRVRSGKGRAEILLTPGSFARLDHETEFTLLNADIENLKLGINRGSAIFEFAMLDGFEGTLALITTPRSTLAITRGGLYRVDVADDGSAVLKVYKGRALIVAPNAPKSKETVEATIITDEGEKTVSAIKTGEGKSAVLNDSIPALASFDRKAEDEFSLYSKNRAKQILAANQRLRSTSDNSRLVANTWVYHPFAGCYTFWPGFVGMYSPYGWNYRNAPYGWFYYPRPRRGYWGGNNQGGGTSGGTNVGSGGNQNRPRNIGGGIYRGDTGGRRGGAIGGRRNDGAAPSRGGRRP